MYIFVSLCSCPGLFISMYIYTVVYVFLYVCIYHCLFVPFVSFLCIPMCVFKFMCLLSIIGITLVVSCVCGSVCMVVCVVMCVWLCAYGYVCVCVVVCVWLCVCELVFIRPRVGRERGGIKDCVECSFNGLMFYQRLSHY